MANTIEIILKGTDKASKEFDKVEKSTKGLKDVFLGLSSAAAGIAGAGVIIKKALDLGREGAAIEQTGESFDFLMDKVKAAPDLMDQLTAASHGTISAFELQSSTMTLLAGAQGELATQLANATPRLLEIAKAANKLNPALGTTSFMYESIATGVKRAQPLILDNLGLTLKVGDANAAMAEKLGKTVKELTNEEKSLAILNATLEAGDTLVGQVGGTTDSATDAFDQLGVAVKEIADAVKKKLVPGLTDAAKAATLFLTSEQKLRKVFKLHAEDLLEQGIGYEEFAEKMRMAADIGNRELLPWGDEMIALYRALGMELPETIMWTDDMSRAMFLNAQEAESGRINHGLLIQEYEAEKEAARKLAEETDNFTEIILAEKSAVDLAREANKKFLDGIDRDLASPIDSFVKDIEWFLATGGQFEAAWLRIQALAKTAPEEALGMAQELLVMIEDSRAELNMTTGDEAAQNIADTLGIELWEANQKIRGTDGLHESMAGLGDIYIDLSELERMEAITLRILDNLTLMRTPGIQIGVPGQGFPAETGDPVERPGTTPGGEPTDIPRHENIPEFTTGGASITQNFTVNNELDIEEIAARLAEA
jgi:hypothetical protein